MESRLHIEQRLITMIWNCLFRVQMELPPKLLVTSPAWINGLPGGLGPLPANRGCQQRRALPGLITSKVVGGKPILKG